MVLSSNDDAQSTGVITASDIYGLKMPTAKLVVLASCQTADGRVYKGEGLQSLVCPFLIAGAPVVVAARWAVDSKATKALMTRFHYERRIQRAQIQEALRTAQLDMLNGGDPVMSNPYYWGAFVAVGAWPAY
jgi:CHAT domain-containing protein